MKSNYMQIDCEPDDAPCPATHLRGVVFDREDGPRVAISLPSAEVAEAWADAFAAVAKAMRSADKARAE